MEISKEIQNINNDDLFVLYYFKSLYPLAQIDLNSNWPEVETAYPFQICMSVAVCSLFNSGRWNELTRSAFLTVNCQNPENLIFQHHLVREKINKSYKNNRLEENKKMRNAIKMDTLTSVDIVQK